MVRRRKIKAEIEDRIYRYSPLKRGLKVRSEDEVYCNYNKIMPRLYLGNIDSTTEDKLFREKGIKAVLNCTKNIPNAYEGVEYMRIPVNDSLKEVDIEKMYRFADVAATFIHKHVDLEKHNMLVHCHAGRQRSAICVAFYLIKYHKMTPEKAYKFIIDKRPEAFHYGKSLNFNESLLAYYKDVQKCK